MDSNAYLAAHGVEAALSDAVQRVLRDRPVDAVAAIGSHLCDRAYAEAVKYIFANADFTGSAKRYQNPQMNWERFDALLEKLGRPLRGLKVVHIAGTNGKGTTSALCEAMLRASGVGSVGLFTSPHLHSFRERIRVDGRLVTKEAIVAAMNIVRPAVEELGYASPFEKLSALAFVCFRRENVEWAVLETGLGGRWDCTNHCAPLVVGVTRIGFDHMNVLGSTISQIAGEKAGIIKGGVPAFCVPQHEDALPVLAAAAEHVGTTLSECNADADASIDSESLAFWLSPHHQQHNCSMALAMVRSLAERGHLPIKPSVWHEALNAACWPARFEVFLPAPLRSGQRLIIDVAHNEPAVGALLASVDAGFPQAPLVAIFGANADKDVRTIVRLLCAQPRLRRAVAVRSSHPKAISAGEIVNLAHEAQEAAGSEAAAGWVSADSMLDALDLAASAISAEAEDEADALVLCCGSVFVAADMRAALALKQPELFATADWVFEQAAEPALLM